MKYDKIEKRAGIVVTSYFNELSMKVSQELSVKSSHMEIIIVQ